RVHRRPTSSWAATADAMDDEGSLASLRLALQDRLTWVRTGAASAAPYLAPSRTAAALLSDRADALAAAKPSEEAAAVAIALAQVGSDRAIEVAAKYLKDDPGNLLKVVEADNDDDWVNYLDKRTRAADLSPPTSRLLRPYLNAWHVGQHDTAQPLKE